MKSHVSMEQKKCAVCALDYDSGNILLDRRFKASMERHTLTGWGLCPDCQKKKDEGYIALVGADASKSKPLPNGNLTLEGAYRTGEVIHIKVDAFSRVFNIPATDSDGKPAAFVFIDPEAMDKIKAMVSKTP